MEKIGPAKGEAFLRENVMWHWLGPGFLFTLGGHPLRWEHSHNDREGGSADRIDMGLEKRTENRAVIHVWEAISSAFFLKHRAGLGKC